VTIYDGGMVYDTSECSADYSSFQAPLSGPTGKGVASIALPSSAEFAAEKYIGPPVVTITGSGTAASALVDFDDATRTLKGVIITCPGFGYGAGTTATVASADGRSSYACTVTMFDHTASGGFTKRGAGEVRLTQPSTYGGATIIKAGTVKFEHASSLPSGTSLLVDGGATADLNNIARTVASLGGAGSVSNGDLTVTDALHVNCATAFGGGKITVSGALSFTGMRLVIDDPENLEQYRDAKKATFLTAGAITGMPTAIVAADDRALPANLAVSRSGNSLRFGFNRGMVISFK
jgi:autotransporter-associated beta strand protein